MGRLYELRCKILRDGKISDQEVAVIRNYLWSDGKIDFEDMKFLVELLCDAREVAPAFDELFFPLLKEVILTDGRIGMDEQFYLLKMLYSNGHVRESEIQFLQELRREAKGITPEFEALYEKALHAHPTNWSLGGKIPREV